MALRNTADKHILDSGVDFCKEQYEAILIAFANWVLAIIDLRVDKFELVT